MNINCELFVAPTPPRQLKITPRSPTEIIIEWQPPELSNGKLTHYIISGELAEDQRSVEQRNYCIERKYDELFGCESMGFGVILYFFLQLKISIIKKIFC